MRAVKWGTALNVLLWAVGAWSAQSQSQVIYRGTTSFVPAAPQAAQGLGPEIHTGPEFDASFEKLSKAAVSPARVPADHVPRPADSALGGFRANAGFSGLTHVDQRTASGGNQFSSEPPDQALAVGNGFVLEAVN